MDAGLCLLCFRSGILLYDSHRSSDVCAHEGEKYSSSSAGAAPRIRTPTESSVMAVTASFNPSGEREQPAVDGEDQGVALDDSRTSVGRTTKRARATSREALDQHEMHNKDDPQTNATAEPGADLGRTILPRVHLLAKSAHIRLRGTASSGNGK
jgi:hypothetical protein